MNVSCLIIRNALEIQVINLSFADVFTKYSDKYKIFRESYHRGIFGLEIRHMPVTQLSTVKEITLKEKEICYSSDFKDGELSLFMFGSLIELKNLSKRILSGGNEDLGYKIMNTINNYENYYNVQYILGGKEFDFHCPYIMGILNVTPDSFSDGGLYLNTEAAVKHAIDMLNEGADIIDVGGESTRPGSEQVSEEEEMSRVVPVIEQILSIKKDALISVDTTKKNVAEKALKSGAKIVNDISGLTFDPSIVDVVKRYNAALVIMHIKGTPKNMQENPSYQDVVAEVYDFLFDRVMFAKRNGVEKLFIDPGIGFGKRIEDNFEIIKRLEDFKSIGVPVLIGISRKSFLGKTLNLDVNLRDTATSISDTIAVNNGARIIRTHNVLNAVQLKKILSYLN